MLSGQAVEPAAVRVQAMACNKASPAIPAEAEYRRAHAARPRERNRAVGAWREAAGRVRQTLARLRRDRAGTTAVELALVAPLLAIILVPLSDLGIGAYRQMQVTTAVQAGARYAVLHGFDSTGIGNAVTGATSLAGINATPAPVQSCGCVSGTSITAATCGAACPDGSSAGTYVTVNANASYALLFDYPGLGNPLTLSAQSTVRIK
jgi:Flp pilus assembly protein TadG